MEYSVTFLESQYESLVEHLFSQSHEQAAFILCRQSRTDNSVNLLVREIVKVEPGDILSASPTHLSIRSQAYLRAIKQADLNKEGFIFVHSHPDGLLEFSSQDDREEAVLFKTAYVRIHNETLHASLVLTDKDNFCGRVWFADGSHSPISRVRVIGKRFQFLFAERISDAPLEYYDRQARAFTRALQPILKRLHIGVVGFGGTGSAVCEQLIRLGIGTLTVIDGGLFEKSNVSRVYGSLVSDEKIPKANIASRVANSIGLHTDVRSVQGHLSHASITRRLLDCDMVFGCTDDELGRSILNRLAIRHYIPVFDMGVNIDPTDDHRIRSIQGRVTTLFPGAGCLICRKRISSERIRAESIALINPAEAAQLRKEGYLANIDEPAPSVIAFTSGIAAAAVSEFLHRLTGFQGADRTSTEVIHFFDQSRVRTNATASAPDCLCANRANWGAGDTKRFLDLNWRSE